MGCTSASVVCASLPMPSAGSPHGPAGPAANTPTPRTPRPRCASISRRHHRWGLVNASACWQPTARRCASQPPTGDHNYEIASSQWNDCARSWLLHSSFRSTGSRPSHQRARNAPASRPNASAVRSNAPGNAPATTIDRVAFDPSSRRGPLLPCPELHRAFGEEGRNGEQVAGQRASISRNDSARRPSAKPACAALPAAMSRNSWSRLSRAPTCESWARNAATLRSKTSVMSTK